MVVVHKDNEWVHYVLSFVWQQILEFLLLFVFLSCNFHKLYFESKLKILVFHALFHILKVVKGFEGWVVQIACATTAEALVFLPSTYFFVWKPPICKSHYHNLLFQSLPLFLGSWNVITQHLVALNTTMHHMSTIALTYNIFLVNPRTWRTSTICFMPL